MEARGVSCVALHDGWPCVHVAVSDQVVEVTARVTDVVVEVTPRRASAEALAAPLAPARALASQRSAPLKTRGRM